MDEGKKNKKQKDKEGPSEPFQPSEGEVVKVDKKTKSIIFRVPSEIPSEESFISALSYSGICDDDYEDFAAKSDTNLSFLRKQILQPLRHSQPRVVTLSHCCRTNDHLSNTILADASSKQLFEIARHSPTPSDNDINLINSTYLRRLKEVQEAITEGADVNTSRDGQTPLLIAVEIGDDRLVNYFLTIPNIDVNCQDNFGQTALNVAVKNAYDGIVKLLLEQEVDLNISDNLGNTPLLWALFQKRVSLASLLLSRGADCNKPDVFGETPLHASAVRTPDLKCLNLLLRRGAIPDCVSLLGIPLLSQAIVNDREIAIIKTLINYGASVNYADLITKKTPLHFAALSNNLEVTKLLVRYGADVNVRTTYGCTPLDEANIQKCTLVADYLKSRRKPKKEQVKYPKRGRTDILNTP